MALHHAQHFRLGKRVRACLLAVGVLIAGCGGDPCTDADTQADGGTTSTDGSLVVDPNGESALGATDEPAEVRGVNDPDTDGDDRPDSIDEDDDNDGYPDSEEGDTDTDDDGLPDRRDADSDGDGLPDALEESGDHDGDGKANRVDGDSDNDGCPDGVEGFEDSGSDGPDYLDGVRSAHCDDWVDSDDDGVIDSSDRCPGFDDGDDPDGDGVPTGCDNCPMVPNPSQAQTVRTSGDDSAGSTTTTAPGDLCNPEYQPTEIDCGVGGSVDEPTMLAVSPATTELSSTAALIAISSLSLGCESGGNGVDPIKNCIDILVDLGAAHLGEIGGDSIEGSSPLLLVPHDLVPEGGVVEGCRIGTTEADSIGGIEYFDLYGRMVASNPSEAAPLLVPDIVSQFDRQLLTSIPTDVWRFSAPEVVLQLPDTALLDPTPEAWAAVDPGLLAVLPNDTFERIFGNGAVLNSTIGGDETLTIDGDLLDDKVEFDTSLEGNGTIDAATSVDGLLIVDPDLFDRAIAVGPEPQDGTIEPPRIEDGTFVLDADMFKGTESSQQENAALVIVPTDSGPALNLATFAEHPRIRVDLSTIDDGLIDLDPDLFGSRWQFATGQDGGP
ncbi:MAG: hypothetical protein GY708_26425 [Actinomycetia bacterium]|nr:hypothetical protein [Actinomycetes bacterium]